MTIYGTELPITVTGRGDSEDERVQTSLNVPQVSRRSCDSRRTIISLSFHHFIRGVSLSTS